MTQTELRQLLGQMAQATGCEVKPNALGNPMYTFTGSELIMFTGLILDDVVMVADEASTDRAVGTKILEHFGLT